MPISRRRFLAALPATLATGRRALAHSYSSAVIRFGCAAITWGGNDLQAIDDIASLGFEGIQLRANVLAAFGDRPQALRERLQARRLTMVALSSGNLVIDPAVEREQLDLHVRHARFVRDTGGLYLQVIDERPRDRAVTAADYRRLGQLLTELGRRTADIGVPLGYHHHMDSLGERPDEVRAILAAADPRYVKLQIDTAHYQQGGGDPAAAIRAYRDRLLFLHIKDVQSPVRGEPSRRYRFVELGRGQMNLQAVFEALDATAFAGWAVVELDEVTEPGRTPRESAAISKAYLQDVLGRRIG